MKKVIILLILVPAIVIIVGQQHACLQPIHYRIGEIDPRFKISHDQAAIIAAKAANLWSQAAGKELFIQDAHAALTIDFIYSDLQAKNEQLTKNSQEAKLVEQHGVYRISLGFPFKIKRQIIVSTYSDELALEHLFAHEFGHVIGLPHSKNPSAIMTTKREQLIFEAPALNDSDRQLLNSACQ